MRETIIGVVGALIVVAIFTALVHFYMTPYEYEPAIKVEIVE